LWNHEVFEDWDNVVERIWQLLPPPADLRSATSPTRREVKKADCIPGDVAESAESDRAISKPALVIPPAAE
jgi:hypothetical protein